MLEYFKKSGTHFLPKNPQFWHWNAKFSFNIKHKPSQVFMDAKLFYAFLGKFLECHLLDPLHLPFFCYLGEKPSNRRSGDARLQKYCRRKPFRQSFPESSSFMGDWYLPYMLIVYCMDCQQQMFELAVCSFDRYRLTVFDNNFSAVIYLLLYCYINIYFIKYLFLPVNNLIVYIKAWIVVCLLCIIRT